MSGTVKKKADYTLRKSKVGDKIGVKRNIAKNYFSPATVLFKLELYYSDEAT
jgi:hypothetical protein